MLRLGLTGGIACGKSAAAAAFARRGFHRLDSDAIVARCLADDPEVIAAVAGRFGADLARPAGLGGVDRTALARRVFAAPAELRWLEDLLHPLVYAAWERALAAGPPDACWVIEVPLLYEKSLESRFDAVVVVACSAAVQRARLLARGLSDAAIRQRLDQQLPLDLKVSRADYVLTNDGDPAFLDAQVTLLARRLAPSALPGPA